MASRGIFSKRRRQMSQGFLECMLDVRKSKVRALPKYRERSSDTPADRSTASVFGADTQSIEVSDENLMGKRVLRQEGRHRLRDLTHVALSRSGGCKSFSSVADVGSAYDAKWVKKHSLRGLKPEDLTSSKVSRMLRSWNKNTPTDLANMDVPWNPFIVCGVLKSNIRADAAWEFFNWVKSQEGYRHNVYTFSAMIDLFGKVRNYSAMGSLVEEMRREGHGLSVVTYTILIHWYRHAMDLDSVRRLWKQMDDNAVKPNVVTYTTYIDALVKGDCHLEAMEVYREMQESGCRPNIYTYTVLMHSLVEAGKLEAATELFDKLGGFDCKANSVTYSLIIGAHSKAGNLEKVLSLYRTMRESGLGTSLEQRKLVARALEGVGMTKEAEQILSGGDEHKVLLKLGSKDVIPDKHHEAFGDEAVAPHHLPKPKQLARKLRVWGLETDAILEQVGKRLKPPYVMNVLKELQTNAALAWRFFKWAEAQEGYKHTQYTFMKVMEIVGRVSKTGSNELMEKVLAELEQEGINDLDKFNTLIKYYSEDKNIAGAEQVLNRISGVGCKPSETTYTLLIDMYSRAGMHTKALEMYEVMQKAECRPSMHTYTVLMHSLARSGKITEAETLFESLPSLGHRPNVVTYTALIQSLLNTSEGGKALALYERMKEAKINPSKITLKILAKGLRNAGRLEEAQKIADSLPYMRGMFLEPEESQRVRKGDKEVQELMASYFLESTESSSDAPSGESYAQTAV
ncbi:hypothetical protein M758_UG225300 [Ceratodon purpureus]|nr:hypothetical protein M758_UG225300 [Ceratodon purpureus]KAG0596109.1 hypothetical protein M758_UG225300 [Ceratodon purpureus]KAG0596110.1 hypothetical protein M758_UG225300 [Ceratodon purpureus]KAG0596111.1 hypothetical protein M758_UG225300 [Ceratodon purpureus]KAG0596112.1 hypothetical protein M758_UG225300 [Ceratodon purpureus]